MLVRESCLVVDRMTAFLLAIACLLMMGVCSTVKVKTDSDRVIVNGMRSAERLGSLAATPVSVLGNVATRSLEALNHATRLESNGRSVDAAGCYLKVAVDTFQLLASSREEPGSESEQALIELHNNSLSRFAELWMDDPRRDGSPGPFEFTCEGKTLEARLSNDSAYLPATSTVPFQPKRCRRKGSKKRQERVSARLSSASATIGLSERRS